jgi:hypothetical protein
MAAGLKRRVGADDRYARIVLGLWVRLTSSTRWLTTGTGAVPVAVSDPLGMGSP